MPAAIVCPRSEAVTRTFKVTTQGGWTAGGNGSQVYPQYSIWTDSHIVIDGFGPQYGTTYDLADGDAVSIVIQNSVSPEFAIWTGTLP